MPWTKTTWANLVGTNTTSTEVAPSGTISGNIDCAGANDYISLAVRVSTLFDTAPNKATQVDFFGYNADAADTDVDTIAIYTAEIPQVTTSEEIATYQLNVSALDQMQVLVTNLDSTKSIWVHVSYQAGYW
jgi:hypothetical protein